ncbi:MAG: ATP-binding cassette domain-containing protein [Candidatus Heimdallarchaeota archaeon]|nr:MAG: ATP-binding cassette domain-containing protein [Candidatus Heimdallarchaeota archaeon]
MRYIGIAFHNVRRNKWRSILLILGITLSVALETGIAISIDSLYDNFITDRRLNNYTDINIYSIHNNKTLEEMRELTTTVQSVSGVSKSSTIITHIYSNETLQYLGRGFDINENLVVYGCDTSHPDFQNIELLEGNLRLKNNGILISNTLAKMFGVTPNQKINLSQLIPDISGSVYIRGIMEDSSNFGNLFGYLYILVDADFLCEKLLEAKWSFHIECIVEVDDLLEIDEVVTNIKSTVGEEFLVIRGKIISEIARLGITSYQTAMNIIVLASFVVAILFLANLLTINVNERKKEFGILKSVGTSNFQIVVTLGIEILVYSTLGSFFGTIFGFLFSVMYLTLFNQTVEIVTVTQLVIKPASVGTAFLSGILISLIAGIYPVVIAIVLPPVQNIHYQQRSIEQKWKVTWKYTFLTGIVLSAIGIIGSYFIGPSRFLSFEIVSFHFIVLVLILIGTFLIQTGLLNFLPKVGKNLFWFSTIAKVVSSRNVKREASKSAITIMTSAIALSFIIIIGIVSNALIDAVPTYYNDQFGGIDIIAECYDGQELPITVVEKLERNRDIVEASFIQERSTIVNFNSKRINIFGIDPKNYETFIGPIIAQTKPNLAMMMNTSEQGVIISNLLLQHLNVDLGETIQIILQENITKTLVINGIVRGNPFVRQGLYLYLSNVLFDQFFPSEDEPVAKWFVMSIDDDTNVNNLTKNLKFTYNEFYRAVSIDYFSTFIEGTLRKQAVLFQTLFLESFFLVGLAQFVCILISTLKMEREVGIIRAMGISKKEVFSIFLAESTMLEITAVIIGIIEGVVGAYLMQWYISSSIPIKVNVDPLMIFLWVSISFVITIVSTTIPSYRSSHRSIVSAISGRGIKEPKIIDEDLFLEYLLSVENLKGYYRGSFGVVHGVDNVSLTIKRGEIVGLAGESGCGKSTLAELLTGSPRPLLHYEKGKILVDRFDIYKIRPEALRTQVKCRLLSYVPQASMESLNPVKKIKDFIMDVVEERTGRKGSKVETYKLAEIHFERVGLDKSVLDRYPHELSGGMKQRVVIAISTLWNPNLLIIDEPTSALDVTSQKQMIQMLSDLKNKGIIQSILFVSHDIATLRQLCSRSIIMYCGEIVETGFMDDIINDPLHPYTALLISSIVKFNPDGTRPAELRSIPGSHPDLRYPPPGCRFHPRCPEIMTHCKSYEPPVVELSDKERQVKCWLYN